MRDDIGSLVTAQRLRLGRLAEALDETEWRGPSLCTGWSVGDVVAHCVQSQVATPSRLAAELLAAGLRLTARNERWVAARRQHDRATVLTEYRASADLLRVPSAELPHALTEVVVHGYDIASPTRRPIEVPVRSLVIVANTCRRSGLFLGARKRCAGLTLRASDADWSAGGGPEVIGPLASIVMAITGRAAALGDLSGDGLDTLRSRV